MEEDMDVDLYLLKRVELKVERNLKITFSPVPKELQVPSCKHREMIVAISGGASYYMETIIETKHNTAMKNGNASTNYCKLVLRSQNI